jgi:hypothetical protein
MPSGRAMASAWVWCSRAWLVAEVWVAEPVERFGLAEP